MMTIATPAAILSLLLLFSTTTANITTHTTTNLPIDQKWESKSSNNEKYTIDTPGAPPLHILHGTTTISFTFSEGIICAVDSRASMGNYVGSKTTQKVLPISNTILGTMAGGAADCTYFLRWLRGMAQMHELENSNNAMSVVRASRLLASALYRNRGTDLSVGTMIMGIDGTNNNDDDGRPTIYYVDNTGLRLRGDMFAVGSGSTFAIGILDSVSNKAQMGEKEAVKLAISAIRHATYRDAYSGGYIGVYVVTKDGWRKVFSEDLGLSVQRWQEEGGVSD